jgi:hypothetical protein
MEHFFGEPVVRRNEDGTWEKLAKTWLGYDDKRKLTTPEICDFLLPLPGLYGDTNIIIFGGSYDFTQILAGWSYAKVYEICRRENLKTKFKLIGNTKVLCGHYAASYMKGKGFNLYEIGTDEETGKRIILRKVAISDVFGFYQSSFLKVAASLKTQGLITDQEIAIIARDKKRRDRFNQIPLPIIKEYTTLELEKTSTALTVLREGFDKMQIRLPGWRGTGAAAQALLRKYKIPKHFEGWVLKHDYSKEQEAAHCAFYAGRIEAIKIGFGKGRTCEEYDVISAYPSGCLELPTITG